MYRHAMGVLVKTSIYLPDEMAELVRERGISLSELTQNALRGLMPASAFFSVPAISEIRGVPGVEPVLQVTLQAVTGGLPDGASAMFLVHGQLQAANGRTVDLGMSEPFFEQLSYGSSETRKLQLQPRWRISAAGVERIEQVRAGGNFTLEVGVRYGLMGGTTAPGWQEPHRPVRVPFPDQPAQLIIKAHDWVRDVLEPWQQAAAVLLVIPLPQQGATDDHRAVIARLADARHEVDGGHWKASIAASREAVELLRQMRPAPVTGKAQLRDLHEREAVMLDRLKDLTQAMFDYDSAASHPDPHLRHIAWNRENAVLALGTAVSLAQAIFAHP
jgi:hypothetical protein